MGKYPTNKTLQMPKGDFGDKFDGRLPNVTGIIYYASKTQIMFSSPCVIGLPLPQTSCHIHLYITSACISLWNRQFVILYFSPFNFSWAACVMRQVHRHEQGDLQTRTTSRSSVAYHFTGVLSCVKWGHERICRDTSAPECHRRRGDTQAMVAGGGQTNTRSWLSLWRLPLFKCV